MGTGVRMDLLAKVLTKTEFTKSGGDHLDMFIDVQWAVGVQKQNPPPCRRPQWSVSDVVDVSGAAGLTSLRAGHADFRMILHAVAQLKNIPRV